MNRRKLVFGGFALGALTTLLVLPHTALAGPPLICHPFDIGGAKSLPWGASSWSAAKFFDVESSKDYDLGRLVDDTLALLSHDTPVIVRMETIRRATIYAQKNQRVAAGLLSRLKTRALDAEAKGRPDTLA